MTNLLIDALSLEWLLGAATDAMLIANEHGQIVLASLIGGAGGARHECLANRELEVFKLIAAGKSLVRIGEALHLSPNTVTTYRSRIRDQMKFTSNAELTRYALENGLL